jgi:hypothetical protein
LNFEPQSRCRHARTALAVASLALILATSARADTVYQTPDAFVAEALGGSPPPAFLWLTPALQSGVRALLGHTYPQARLRYWHSGATTVWLLDEVGKEFPITAGFAVRDGRLLRARVLVYRETRGGEIHLQSFLDQFTGAALDNSGKLSRTIDGITGATLSVDAMRRLAKTALYLTSQLP